MHYSRILYTHAPLKCIVPTELVGVAAEHPPQAAHGARCAPYYFNANIIPHACNIRVLKALTIKCLVSTPSTERNRKRPNTAERDHGVGDRSSSPLRTATPVSASAGGGVFPPKGYRRKYSGTDVKDSIALHRHRFRNKLATALEHPLSKHQTVHFEFENQEG